MISGTVSSAFAFDLPAAFDSPCTGGMGILADICDVINDLHDFTHELETSINSLIATQITQQLEINVLQGNVTSNLTLINQHHFEDELDALQTDLVIAEADLDIAETNLAIAQTDISNMKDRLVALETDKSEFDVELRTVGTTNGFLSVRFIESILFFGDTLCEIEQFTNENTLYIQFGTNSTVQHINDCVPSKSGILISLSSGITENFTIGDTLILTKDPTTGHFTEVFRE